MLWFGVVTVTLGSTVWYFASGSTGGDTSYRFATVERGDLESVVSTTGQLSAVQTVSVGTQVSGIISELHADFNDEVGAGQVIARLDTLLLGISVREARIRRGKSEIELERAQTTYDRQLTLVADDYIPQADLESAGYALDIARSNLASAEIGLERAEQNLSYATVYAPISGIVIERNVDIGQTVASSLSAPQLFLIANDLSHMQILASVDESDIGNIRAEQDVRFTVQAYAEETFPGVVRQVRLQSSTQENVVNYTVVIDVGNADGKLLPGMTATVEFLVDRAEDALKVANAALRFQPTSAMLEELRARREDAPGRGDATPGDSTRTRRPRSTDARPADARLAGTGRTGAERTGKRPAGASGPADRDRSNMTLLWYVDDAGELAAARAHTGLTDGQYTQVTGRNVVEGMQVITGVSTSVVSASTATNPFQTGQSSGRRGPPPGM